MAGKGPDLPPPGTKKAARHCRRALHGRRPPDHLNNFITWILSESEMKRRRGQSLELVATLDDLANKCRLTGQLKHANRTRVHATLKRNAEVAQRVNLISSFDFDDPQQLRLTSSPKVFVEAQEWQSAFRPTSPVGTGSSN